MQAGTNWVGPYSRFSYNEAKKYVMMLKEKGVPILDDEFNVMQEILLTLMRRHERYTLGDGTNDTGFKPVGTSATNDFTIKGGTYFVDGWYIVNTVDCTYLTQPVTQPGLTTPGGNRTDFIYLDIWYDEIDTTEDTNLKDPILNSDTSHRLKLYWAVKVNQGITAPINYTDSNNLYHWTKTIGRIFRTATAVITDPMINDDRHIFFPSVGVTSDNVGQVAHFARQTAPLGWLVCDGSAVSRATYSALFNAIGTTFGAGDGSLTFNLPKADDGKFLRSCNTTGSGHDAGRTFGSTHNDMLINHRHILPFAVGLPSPNPNSGHPSPNTWGFGPAPYDSLDIGFDMTSSATWTYGLYMTSGPYKHDNTTLAWNTATDTGMNGETTVYNIALLCCIRYQN